MINYLLESSFLTYLDAFSDVAVRKFNFNIQCCDIIDPEKYEYESKVALCKYNVQYVVGRNIAIM